MSLEQSFSKKLTLGPAGSQQQQQHQDGITTRGKSPTSTDSSPKSSPSKSGKLSLKGLGRSSTSAKRCRSPIRRQQTVISSGSQLQECSSSSKKDKKSEYRKPDHEEFFVPGTSGPPGVDHSPFYDHQSQEKKSAANKIIHNWKSACKDKTKDFIRRWKTLPENHPDFDQVARNSSEKSRKGQDPEKNIVSGGGGSTSTSLAPFASSSTALSTSAPGPSSSLRENANLVQFQQQAQNVGESSSSSGTMVNPSQISGSNPTSLGKFTKNLTKKTDSTDANSGLGLQGLSISNKSVSGVTNGPIQQEDSMQANGTNKSTGWSVHVWATYVQRGHDDVSVNDETLPAREYLSEFQKIKLTHFFRHVLDMNHDDVISAEDFVALNQRIRHYIEWSSECIEFHILKEVHSGFLECFLNQPLDETSVMYYCSSERETRQHVNIDEWLDVWGTLLNSARTMESLPLWLQYFPKILFQVINKSGSGTISKEQLRAFYTMFLGIDFRVVNDTLDSIYNAMTDTGRNKITYGLFKLCFANFLLGKYPHGPGQYLFGICAPATLSCAFPIDYSALNTPKDDLEPYDPDKDKGQSNRRSVIV